MKSLKTFLSGVTRPRTLIFGMCHGMWHHLEDRNLECSKCAPGAKNGPALGVYIIYSGSYREHETSSYLKPQCLEL